MHVPVVLEVRRQVVLPTLEESDPDNAWRAAALLHTISHLEPLPHHNSLYAAFVAAQYMDQSGETIDPPYGALSDLVHKIRGTRLDVYTVADHLRTWKI
ncbi:toxin Doc [Streptomyces sp. NPDC057717]|uniref:toxin Doc n=1 Tax=Streptomyces sp. NPDC057717 TaxID=3346224 RepID=UPI00368E5831